MVKQPKAAEPQKPLRPNPACTRCLLYAESRTVCCEGAGPFGAAIMLVGEALGLNEDEVGRPFVGDAGHKLNYCLSRAGLERKRCRIENCIRCRPPKNRKPTKKEGDACWPYLLRDILMQRPKVIVALGATATLTLIEQARAKKGRTVDTLRGFYERRTFSWTSPKGVAHSHTCYVVPTYHPAACLRDWQKDDLLVFDLLIAKELSEGREPLRWPATEVKVLRTLPEVLAFLRSLGKTSGFVVDLETTSLRPHSAEIMCIGFCRRAGHATILPLLLQDKRPCWTAGERRQIVEELARLLEEAELWGQNIKFDAQHLRKLTGVWPLRVGFDTMLAHHVLDENKPHNLTFLCQWFLGWQRYDALTDAYKPSEKVFETWKIPDEVLWRYCAYDVDGCFQLRSVFMPMLEAERVEEVFALELGLVTPLADMEFRGMRLDRGRIVELSERYRAEVTKAVRIVRRIAVSVLGPEHGETFNYNSQPQLGALLARMGAALRKKTRGGRTSVDKFVLAALSLKKNRPATLARAVLTIRKLEKYIGVYLDGISATKRGRGRPLEAEGGFIRWMQEYDRIHPNYNIAIARTGRLSADDPPIQTVPRTGSLRSMVVPDTDDDLLLSVDYEKLELCVMSWLANDDVMVAELKSGVDLHTKMGVTARLMRDPTPEEFEQIAPLIGKNERAVAKGVNFGIPYGRGASAIAEANPDAFPLGMAKDERKRRVQKVIDAYFEKYWRIAEYRERQIDRLMSRGVLRTTVHRRARRLTGIDWFNSRWGKKTEHRDLDISHLEREALNCEIQSIGSDTLSIATRRCYEGMAKVRLPAFRIVMSLHDALIFNIRRGYEDEAQSRIERWMETILPRDSKHRHEMTLKVECKVCEYWGQGDE